MKFKYLLAGSVALTLAGLALYAVALVARCSQSVIMSATTTAACSSSIPLATSDPTGPIP